MNHICRGCGCLIWHEGWCADCTPVSMPPTFYWPVSSGQEINLLTDEVSNAD